MLNITVDSFSESGQYLDTLEFDFEDVFYAHAQITQACIERGATKPFVYTAVDEQKEFEMFNLKTHISKRLVL